MKKQTFLKSKSESNVRQCISSMFFFLVASRRSIQSYDAIFICERVKCDRRIYKSKVNWMSFVVPMSMSSSFCDNICNSYEVWRSNRKTKWMLNTQHPQWVWSVQKTKVMVIWTPLSCDIRFNRLYSNRFSYLAATQSIESVSEWKRRPMKMKRCKLMWCVACVTFAVEDIVIYDPLTHTHNLWTYWIIVALQNHGGTRRVVV